MPCEGVHQHVSESNLLEKLIAAAIRAPSGDNTQPWRFLVDSTAGQLSIQLDEIRDPSPMNAGQRMARIAIGAALENVLRMARCNGLEASVVERQGAALATIRIASGDHSRVETEPVLKDRVTNRRLYDGRAVPEQILAALQHETPELEGVKTYWVVARERLVKLASLIGAADATMFGEPSMRRAFLGNVRFDAPVISEVEEGLSLASLELTAMDRLALRTLRRLPDVIVRFAGIMKVFATKARALVESASGLCLIVAHSRDQRADLVVGRAMQRAWLALTAHGLAVQPMMSLCVLDNVLEHGSSDVIASLDSKKATALGEEFRSLAPEIGDGRAAFLMRFGFARPSTLR